MKGVRARLYYDAGLDTVEKITYMDPDELRERMLTYGEETGLVGVPTLPVEANYSVEKARE